jgi:hypothetical protein
VGAGGYGGDSKWKFIGRELALWRLVGWNIKEIQALYGNG